MLRGESQPNRCRDFQRWNETWPWSWSVILPRLKSSIGSKISAKPLIEHVEVFDQYMGVPIPEGKKSLAYKISYRAEDRTLTDLEVNALHQSLVDRLGKTFGAERRS